jgi:hypothetical protein
VATGTTSISWTISFDAFVTLKVTSPAGALARDTFTLEVALVRSIPGVP